MTDIGHFKKERLEKTKISSLDDFKKKYEHICWLINAVIIGKRFDKSNITIDKWVTWDKPVGDATPFIAYDSGNFIYIISERGKEYERLESADPYEIMYRIFKGITNQMASDYELKNRIEGQDSRKIMFTKQIELMQRIDEEWGKNIALEIERRLENHPFSA